MAAKSENIGFDPDLLRNKYREERDKRLRTDGNDQYKDCLLYTSPSPRDS